MISLDDLKEAVLLLDDVSDVEKTTDTNVAFKCKGIPTALSTYEGDKIASVKLCLMNTFKAPKGVSTKRMGENLADIINIKSLLPVKVIHFQSPDDQGAFIFRNIFTDKLNELSKSKKIGRESYIINLKVLILGLMLENLASLQEVRAELNNILDGASNEKK